MAINPVFNGFQSPEEQSLHNDLVIEAIQFGGIDWIYIPREIAKFDKFEGEPRIATFTETYLIEGWLDTNMGWDVTDLVMTKPGGFVNTQSCQVMFSRTRWQQETMRKFPFGGDILYFPKTRAFLEIRSVDFENPFYHLGALYTFTCNCKMLPYSHEVFNTGTAVIDRIMDEHKYSWMVRFENNGTGDFLPEEWVFQGDSLETATAKAYVKSWDRPTGTLELRDNIGDFTDELPYVGAVSGASWLPYGSNDQYPLAPLADNAIIDEEFSQMIDITEPDPMGILSGGNN